MKNPGFKQRLFQRLDIIGLLAFSIAVLLITFPNLLFSANIEDIPKAVIYYRYFFAAAFVILLVVTLIFLFLRRRIALILASLLGAYALMVLIFDFVRPLDIGPLVEGTESVSPEPAAGPIQIALIIAAFFVLFYIPRKVRTVLAWSLAAVLLVSGLPFLFAASGTGHIPEGSFISENESAPDFNVYHILFDSYYGPWLEWSLDELSRDTSELAGFTHYRRNISNYWYTKCSYPSFMSGSLWSSNMTIRGWYDSADENSIINDLHERGFSTTFYGLGLKDGIGQVEVAYTDDPGGVGIVDIKLATDYWLLRVSPVALRHLVLDDRGAGPITRYVGNSEEVPSGDIRTLVSYRQFEEFLADEPLRPADGQYVHVYLYPPHAPFQLDRDGNYVGESSYDEQLLLATNMLLEIVETLKELGKFESSLIIVHADHGAGWWHETSRHIGDPLRDFIQMDAATSNAIQEVDVFEYPGRRHEARYQALLLIKSCGVDGDAGDLLVNDALVQLADIRKYINKVIDEGDCAYAYPEREQVEVHFGIHRQKQNGKEVVVGRDITSGYINHYIIRPGGEWEICDNIQFEY
ncbi:MAG: hypothetical protein R6U93_08235 [Dehalococcoidia bacterium]